MCSRGHSETEESSRMLKCRAGETWKVNEGREGQGFQIKMIPQLLDGGKASAPFDSHTLHTWVSHFILCPASAQQLKQSNLSFAGNFWEIYIHHPSQAYQRKQCYSEVWWWYVCTFHRMPSSECPQVTLSLFGLQLQTPHKNHKCSRQIF